MHNLGFNTDGYSYEKIVVNDITGIFRMCYDYETTAFHFVLKTVPQTIFVLKEKLER